MNNQQLGYFRVQINLEGGALIFTYKLYWALFHTEYHYKAYI
jgi:hypothetical protein